MKTQHFDINKVNLHFTADNHFMHNNVIEYCGRPFDGLEDMNEQMINNWNNVVKEEDIVFVLGDFIFRGTQKHWNYFISKLNGFIWLIKGNHDVEKAFPKHMSNKFTWIDGFLNIKVIDEEIDGKSQYVTLCHYPMLSWYQSQRGSWQLFGHVHEKPVKHITSNQLNVGVDIHDFVPISWNEVKTIITKQNLT